MNKELPDVSIAFAIEESHEEGGVTVITRVRLLSVAPVVMPRLSRRTRLRRWLSYRWREIVGYLRKAVKRV